MKEAGEHGTWSAGLRLGGAALLAALAAAPAGAGQEEDEVPRPRGILLISIDALRADHVTSYGYDRDTTSALDQLASEGVAFTQAFTSAPLSIPAHVGLFTGCEPLLARRVLPEGEISDEQRWNIPDELPRLAVEFLAAGYETAAFVDDQTLRPSFGFGAGFQDYTVTNEKERDAGLQCDRVLRWIKARGRDQRWFAMMHLNDLERCWFVPDTARESYYEPRPELGFIPPVGSTNDVFFALPNDRWRGGSRTLARYETIYDGHLRKVDEALGRLIAGLRAARLLEDTVVCVVGSFGVQFGEAGLYLRSGRYSMADLHVPWIVRVPHRWPVEGEPPGARVEALVSLLDVGPTLAELAGLEAPSGMQGISQARYIHAPGEGPPPRGTTRRHAFASCGLQEGVAVIDWRGHCLEVLIPDRTLTPRMRRSWFGQNRLGEGRPTLRFYDRSVDPYPPLGTRVTAPPPTEYEAMYSRAERWLENVTLARRVLQENVLVHEKVDEETVERLKATGYLGRHVRNER